RSVWLVGLTFTTLITSFSSSPKILLAQNPATPAGSLEQTCLPSGNARVSRQRGNGPVRFIGTDLNRAIRHPRPQQALGAATAAARAYFAACGSLFNVQDEAGELRLIRSMDVDAQRSVVRFQQLKAGVPTMGGELIVHLDSTRSIQAVMARTIPSPAINT